MDKYFISIGVIGSVMSIAGNLPMLFHLLRAKDVKGQNVFTWWIWQIANILLLIYASFIQDFVFILLQVMWVIFCSIMIYLITRYKRKEKNVTAD